MKIKKLSRILVLLALTPLAARADLLIDLDFTDFYGDTDVPSSQTRDTILGGASLAETENVIRAAANYWQEAFANSNSTIGFAENGRISQTIAISWETFTGNTLARGGTSYYVPSYEFAGGTVEIDNANSNFFVDKTPHENSEWRNSSQRSVALNGVNMNIENVYFNAPAGAARNNSDLLSVMIHEIGHALGLLGGYGPYVNTTTANPGFITITSGRLNGARIAIDGGHLDNSIMEPDDYPYDANFTMTEYVPQAMGHSLSTGTRGLLSEADIASLAEVLKFDMATVNFMPVIQPIPEPSTYGLLAGAGFIALADLRRVKRKGRLAAKGV